MLRGGDEVTDTIEKLVVKVQADIEQAQRNLEKVQSSMKNMGDEATVAGNKMQKSGEVMTFALKKVKLAAAAASAALGVIGFKAINAAGDAEEIRNKFEAVFKETSDSAETWASDFSDTVGRSTLETLKYLSTFQDTFVPLGFDRDEATDLSEQLVQLSVDLASFNNELDTDAIASLQSALVGNHETMRRYGVIITQATLDQELLNMGIEGGTTKATEMEKVQARLNIIMASTTDAQGDAARTADSYANQLRALKGNISDVMAEAGNDAMNDLTDTIIDFNAWGTAGGYDQMTDAFSDVADVLSNAAKAGAELIKIFVELHDLVTPDALESEFEMYPESFTQSMFPDQDLDAIQRWLDSLNSELESEKNTQNGLTDELENQTAELVKQSSTIPEWAGHSDYIRSRLAATGTKNLSELVAIGGGTQETTSASMSSSSGKATVVAANTTSSISSQLANLTAHVDMLRDALKAEPRKVDMDVSIKNYSDIGDFENTLAQTVASGVSGKSSVI